MELTCTCIFYSDHQYSRLISGKQAQILSEPRFPSKLFVILLFSLCLLDYEEIQLNRFIIQCLYFEIWRWRCQASTNFSSCDSPYDGISPLRRSGLQLTRLEYNKTSLLSVLDNHFSTDIIRGLLTYPDFLAAALVHVSSSSFLSLSSCGGHGASSRGCVLQEG